MPEEVKHFKVKWKRTVEQDVYAWVDAESEDDAILVAKAGRNEVEIEDTIDTHVVEESGWKVVKE